MTIGAEIMANYSTSPHIIDESPKNYNPSLFGLHSDHRNVDWMLNSPASPSLCRRGDFIGRYGFTDAFSQHAVRRGNSFGSSGSSKRVKWNKNVKSGRQTVGCAAFQQGCSALPSAFEDVSTVNARAGSQRSLLQRLADVTISNVQKCGIGIGRQCDGKAVNISALKKMVEGEMCMKCGVNDDDAFGFANGRCPQCQTDSRHYRNMHSKVGYSQPIISQLNRDYSPNNMASLRETQDAITKRRDAIVASPMQSRLDLLRSDEMRSQPCSYTEPEIQSELQKNYGKTNERATGSSHSILKDENDRYAINYHNVQQIRRGIRPGKSNSKKTMKEKTKLVGGAMVKSFSNPINRLKHGMQRNGAKRVLAITKGDDSS